jgi:MFS family permease
MEGSISTTLVAAFGCIGGFNFGFQTGIIATARDPILDDFGFSTSNAFFAGLITSSVLLGAMIGSFIGGVLAGKYGRRLSNAIGCGLCLYGILGACFSPEIWLFLVFRVFLGAGIGITAVVCPMYVSEMSPPEKRGSLGVLFQLALTLGIFVSFLYGWGIGKIEYLPKFYQWRIELGLGIIIPLALLILTLMKMVEPTTWLEGREAKRGSHMQQLENAPSVGDVCRQPHLRLLLLTNTILASILQLTGINAVMYYGPNILKKSGIKQGDAVNIGIGAWNFVSTIAAVFLVDRLGRRPLMLLGVALITVSLIMIGVVSDSHIHLTDTGKSASVIVGLAIFIFGFEVGPGCLFWVIINELFPESYIEFGGTYANILQWGFNLLVSTVFPVMLTNIGPAATFYIFGGIGALCFIYTFFLLPETKATEDDVTLLRGD